MSGIYGIINLKGNPVDKEQMDKMETLMIHRGVDGKAQWIDNNVGLGHLKLEITPESEYETLPLRYKQWVVTADCRIDNREELDEPLSISEEERSFTPDSTYIVKAYEKWGKDCVHHLIGDFAFAIWDTVEQSLFCVRDHIGIKPFFYLKTDDKFIFASELKAIIELREVCLTKNEQKWIEYIYDSHDLQNPSNTFWEGYKRLLPAHYIDNIYTVTMTQYWELKPKKYVLNDSWIQDFKNNIYNAINCRIRTKYNIGATLSGGIDSSSIVCIAADFINKENKNIYCVSSIGNNRYNDELSYINTIIHSRKNIISTLIQCESIDYIAPIEEHSKTTLFPFNSMFAMDLQLVKALKRQDVKLLLSGFLGDMAVSLKGNFVILDLFLNRNWKSLFTVLKQKSLVDQTSMIKTLFYFIIINYKNISEIYYFFKKLLHRPYCSQNNVLHFKTENLSLTHYYIINNIKNCTTNFEEEELQHSYNHINGTYPFADIRLLQYIIDIPLNHILWNGWDRGIIRYALADIVPPNIIWRRNKKPYIPEYISIFPKIIQALKSKDIDLKYYNKHLIRLIKAPSHIYTNNSNYLLNMLFKGYILTCFNKLVKNQKNHETEKIVD